MLKDNSKNLCPRGDRIDYTFLSLLSNKINVGIIGLGKAGIIKAKHFLKENVKVSIIDKELALKDLEPLKEFNNFKAECREYEKDFILDKHIIVIAVNDEKARERIKKDCDALSKIYIDCTNFKEGIAALPVQRETDNIIFGVNTRGGNPKASVMSANKALEILKDYDGFVELTTYYRNKFKEYPDLKEDALKFLFCDDFYFFFERGKAKKVMKLFYNEV
ncbi:MAG: NAD(P)-dependent oxidoreductase [Clostridium sp.]|uniref:NAD(P)-dependent oxidoreductase n=1 Tax=Clostridium sp. DSM 8431 TaxID=1761781 RepID=UPI0008E369E9|nr:NAD(P)-dependent oxidoreductase [Clostridium sp. DSM 8431]MCR4943705.1 NAD(P)-dependent oxidoreductase [Clostridium sp.]SFU42317.1 precorrin-2 dehydrogenase / sirohydrochlorin ferrochelatase [Clostridium sp. DSM 8431]